jgi:NADH-quinone oxidoreductase subunit C
MTAEGHVAAFGPDARAEEAYGQVTVDVPVSGWVEALTRARDELGFRFFDWLSAVDQLDEGFDVVVHLWSLEGRQHLLLRTRVPAVEPRLPTATGVFAGAGWHERETFEMFGIDFEGHPHLVPLLLPDGFEGHPLRKDFVLAARVAKPWPGAKEPGESDRDHGEHGEHGERGERGTVAPGRRKNRPPGVPEPEDWGPRPPEGSPS